MKISITPRDNCSILHLTGEFGTLDSPPFLEEVTSLTGAGVRNIVLNLRLTKYINSTALGALIKAAKIVETNGGKLVISRPSVFCRTAITGVGLDSVIPLFENDDIAIERLQDAGPTPASDDAKPVEEENNTVLFAPVDQARAKEIIAKSGRAESTSHRNWHGVGNVADLDTKSLRFFWDGGHTGLPPASMAELLSPGSDLKVKFRLPLLQRGYREAVVTVGEASEEGAGVCVVATYKDLDQETADAVEQYTKDVAYLKKELHQATEGMSAGGES